jgi:hypothetical protein
MVIKVTALMKSSSMCAGHFYVREWLEEDASLYYFMLQKAEAASGQHLVIGRRQLPIG